VGQLTTRPDKRQNKSRTSFDRSVQQTSDANPDQPSKILDELAERLLPQEASLTVKQVAGSLDASISDEIEIQKLRVEANSPYNDGWTKQFYDKELQKVTEKRDQDYMYNWIRSKSGK